jgi:hypothetical protein
MEINYIFCFLKIRLNRKTYYSIENEKYFETIEDLINYYEKEKSILPKKLSKSVSHNNYMT